MKVLTSTAAVAEHSPARMASKTGTTACGAVIRPPSLSNANDGEDKNYEADWTILEKRVRWKVDVRLCTIAGLLCSLNLLDSGILSSAAVTSMLHDLQLDQGSRYSVSIFVFTIASVVFQLPCTVAVRFVGPRLWFATITFIFGLLTLCTAWIHTWRQMIALRVLLGIAILEVIVLATGNLVNFGLNHLDGRADLTGWRWMYLIQGLISCILGIVTYWWMKKSFFFLSKREARVAALRIQYDRADLVPEPFSWGTLLSNFKDLKIYGFACMFFLLNLVSTSLSYFLPIILQSGMGFDSNQSILLSTPPYYYTVIPVLLTSLVGDYYRMRGPMITFNALTTGAYVSNWAALNAFQANNVVGQWKRAATAAAITACNGLGGVAGSYLVRQQEAPQYQTAVWVSIGSHVLLVAIVAAFTLYFYVINRRQARGLKIIEDVCTHSSTASLLDVTRNENAERGIIFECIRSLH
ncbi:Major facilitator superfamily domain general substrate transporter [Penicillium capsulatum]|nr:Major facilitator superfamily domain general substrate transporter [Penicillium capsulatum]